MRYFIVSYLYGNGDFGSGVVGIKSETYPNINKIRREVFVDRVTPINIIEVNETDYISFWNKGD